MIKSLHKAVFALFTVMMGAIVLLILFGFDRMDFQNKRTFLLPQPVMMLFGVLITGLLAWAAWRASSKPRALAGGKRFHAWLTWALFFAALFVAQATLCYFSYFLTGWDAGMILDQAYWIGVCNAEEVNNYYYSFHPNNVLITLLFSGIFRAFAWITHSEPSLARCVYVLILVQCALNTLTGMLCCRTAWRLTGSAKFARAVAVLYAAFVGLSPWLMIPYTDSMALIFPSAILCLLAEVTAPGYEGSPLAGYVGIGLLTGLGYLIKPQTVIVTIAIVLIMVLRMLCMRRFRRMLTRLAGMGLAFVAMVGPFQQAVVALSPFELDPELNIGLLHFAMMGLCEKTNGGYCMEDEQISVSVPTAKERTDVQMAVIKERLSTYGVTGLAAHLAKKTLTNYADGTFAWGIEGQFFREAVEDKDDVLSPFLKRQVVTDDPAHVPVLETYFQILWLGLLACSLLCGFAWRACLQQDQRLDLLLIIQLSIIGLTLFELIFEARARYLFAYAPFYVLAGLSGAWYTLEAFAAKRRVMQQVR